MFVLLFFVKSVLGLDVDLLIAVDYLNCFNIILLNVVVYVDIVLFMYRFCSY